MNEAKPEPAAEPAVSMPQVVPRKRRGISLVWFVPITAALLGAWLGYETIAEQGPEITISFQSAEGLEAGKTKIKHRSVELGVVQSVTLTDDLKRVRVTARLDREAAPHLRSGTRFWVVRPRVGHGGISGLGTLLSGAYIELEPGQGEAHVHYVGLEEPPISPADAPGLKIVLETDQAGSLSAGCPIYYRGIEVGEVEGDRLVADGSRIVYDAIIAPDHIDLVRTNTNFWNASGFDIELGADGLEVHTESLESLLIGGLAFDTPEPHGPAASPGETYRIFQNRDEVEENLIRTQGEHYTFVLYFEESVRGLQAGAPVTFRGVRIGQVMDLRVEYAVDEAKAFIPVHAQVDTARFTRVGEKREVSLALGALVRQGLRARLETGSFVTGAKFIDLDFHPETPIRLVGRDQDVPEIPTTVGTFAALARKVEAMELEELVNQAAGLLAGAEKLVNAPETRKTITEASVLLETLRTEAGGLIGNLNETLARLETTLEGVEGMVREESQVRYLLSLALRQVADGARAVKQLADALERQPSSLIYGKSDGR